jgi:cytochrome bd-type quinol oxidase subunit 2
MEKILLLAISISVLFLIIKLVMMKYVEKDTKPLKFLVRDAFVVFASSFLPIFVFFQMSGTFNTLFGIGGGGGGDNLPQTQIFTDTPGF